MKAQRALNSLAKLVGDAGWPWVFAWVFWGLVKGASGCFFHRVVGFFPGLNHRPTKFRACRVLGLWIPFLEFSGVLSARSLEFRPWVWGLGHASAISET